MDEIEKILNAKGFWIKEWICNEPGGNIQDANQCELPSGMESDSEMEGVLGLKWEVKEDLLRYKFNSTFRISDITTKRSILSVTNSIYDPLGLLTPFTTRAKIIIRSIWVHEPKLDWDSQLPEEIVNNWRRFTAELPKLTELAFPRALKPLAAVGKPELIIFSDGSEVAFGAGAYMRWEVQKGKFGARLIMAKSRMAPHSPG